MSKILVTHGGKVGDCLWALPSVRALSEQQDMKVDMVVSTYLRPLVPLIKAQSYINDCFVQEAWDVEFTAPISPRVPPINISAPYDLIWDASMIGWPKPTIIEDHARRAGVSFDPWEPWLKPLTERSTGMGVYPIGVCFTSEWAELKAGLILGLLRHFPEEKFVWLTYPDDRLAQEFTYPFRNIQTVYTSISGLSDWQVGCKMVICCKSMARVMAVGLGVPTVVCEPSEPRRNPVFDMPAPNEREIICSSFDMRELCQNVELMLQRLKNGARF